METKKVTISNKEYEVKELLAVQSDELMDMDLDKPSKRIITRLKMQCGITDEEYSKITEKERDLLLGAMNEVNGWGKFRETENSNSQIDEKG